MAESITNYYTGLKVSIYSSSDNSTLVPDIKNAYCYPTYLLKVNSLSGYVIVVDNTVITSYGYFTNSEYHALGITADNYSNILPGKSTEINITDSLCPSEIHNWTTSSLY
jgi:hypothetical protein